MASRKRLKKEISHICGDLIANCSVLHLCGINDREKTDALLKKALGILREHIARANHTEKGSERLFYKKLREDFAKEAEALRKEING